MKSIRNYLAKGFITALLAGNLTEVYSQSSKQDSLEKAHKQLMLELNSFSTKYISRKKIKGEIEKRIEKTERAIGSTGNDTTGAMIQIKIYRTDSIFYKEVYNQGDSLLKILSKHDKYVMKSIPKSELSDKLLLEIEEKKDNLTEFVEYVGSLSGQVNSRLQKIYKELRRMKQER